MHNELLKRGFYLGEYTDFKMRFNVEQTLKEFQWPEFLDPKVYKDWVATEKDLANNYDFWKKH